MLYSSKTLLQWAAPYLTLMHSSCQPSKILLKWAAPYLTLMHSSCQPSGFYILFQNTWDVFKTTWDIYFLVVATKTSQADCDTVGGFENHLGPVTFMFRCSRSYH